MKNTLFLQQRRARTHLRFGSRTVILFESEMPTGDTPMERHVQELSGLLCQHAAKAYLPTAAAELEMLAGNGTGYEFSPHRLLFCARPSAH